ncbi:GIY-YIG nuclease family protein [Photobacterium sp. WH24]|uniref:GIY-YIG nuclease family protein n=1 Tax=Photobacterium sp. WH24 TaxID=2827237 RepID=UPI001C45A043|nr:GIY-YIG nuclease family protein [Photobacterium sp. WH24]MBV7262731.1 GIY-YIG nuclease family protein [Photobacterium sp. WH24]
MDKHPCVYILASKKNGTMYIGVTSNLVNRIWLHKQKEKYGFTRKYNVLRLVYFEQVDDMYSAIQREKQLKKWRRQWKMNLIEKSNPQWRDLYSEITGFPPSRE